MAVGAWVVEGWGSVCGSAVFSDTLFCSVICFAVCCGAGGLDNHPSFSQRQQTDASRRSSYRTLRKDRMGCIAWGLFVQACTRALPIPSPRNQTLPVFFRCCQHLHHANLSPLFDNLLLLKVDWPRLFCLSHCFFPLNTSHYLQACGALVSMWWVAACSSHCTV